MSRVTVATGIRFSKTTTLPYRARYHVTTTGKEYSKAFKTLEEAQVWRKEKTKDFKKTGKEWIEQTKEIISRYETLQDFNKKEPNLSTYIYRRRYKFLLEPLKKKEEYSNTRRECYIESQIKKIKKIVKTKPLLKSFRFNHINLYNWIMDNKEYQYLIKDLKKVQITNSKLDQEERIKAIKEAVKISKTLYVFIRNYGTLYYWCNRHKDLSVPLLQKLEGCKDRDFNNNYNHGAIHGLKGKERIDRDYFLSKKKYYRTQYGTLFAKEYESLDQLRQAIKEQNKDEKIKKTS